MTKYGHIVFCSKLGQFLSDFDKTLYMCSGTSRAPQSTVLGMLRWFGKIEPTIDQIRAWLSRGHPWAPGVKFHKKKQGEPPSPTHSLWISAQYLLNCGFCGQIIAKNQLNRPYLSSWHLRNRSPQIRYNSAIFQYFCMKL